MLGKLHLICMKTKGLPKVLMLKLYVIQMAFHTSVKRRVLTFNSYNYNCYRYSFSKVLFNYLYHKVTFPVNNISRI